MAQHRRNVAFGASVAGTSHLRNGLHRQDRFDYCVLDSVTITAVCDGAGSAPRSESGAELAAKSAVTAASRELRKLKTPPDPETLAQLLRRSVQCSRQRIAEVASLTGYPLNSYATTLLLAVQTEHLVGGAQIGDGAIVVSDGAGEFLTFTYPQNGEYANQTNFLTSGNAMDCLEVRVETLQPRYLAMFTDGIQNLVLKQPDQVPQTPFFSRIFQWLERQTDNMHVQTELDALLRSPQVTQRTDDDLTLVLAIRK